jgi:hypothetical protein
VPEDEDYGEYFKIRSDGEAIYRRAFSPSDVIRFRFDGWQKVEPLPPAPPAPKAERPARTRPTPATDGPAA